MCRLKNLMLNLFFAGVIAMPAALYGQDNYQSSGTDSLNNSSTTQQSTEGNSMGNAQGMNNSAVNYTPNQIDESFAKLNEKPDDNVKTELEGVAETHAKDLQTKLGLDDDAYSNIKDAINDYLKEGWEDRVELAKEAGDPDAYKDKSADLAYLRVDLAENIKDEIGDGSDSKWNANAVDFWSSLDQADFRVKAKEAGIPLRETSGDVDQNQMNMNNDQQNMNRTDETNSDQNQGNTDQNNTDQNNTDQNNSNDENSSDQNSTDQTNPDQGQ